MKKINGLIAGSLFLISNTGFAEEFCLSNNSTPTHCNAGDIILVAPVNVPLACDFSKQILQMSQKDKSPEYLCFYTGKVLKIKKAPVKAPPPGSNNRSYAPPPPRKTNKSMFDSMPFMK